MPKLSCPWAGLSPLPGSYVMTNADCSVGVLLHELGHNYGLYHSNVLLPSGVRESFETTVSICLHLQISTLF